MNRCTVGRVVAAAVLLIAPAAVVADTSGPPDHPRHPWMSHRPGSFARYKRITSRNGGNTELVQTTTLREVTKAGYTLEFAYDNNAAKPREATYAADYQDFLQQFDKGASGKETITVGGKSYACTWTEYSYKEEKKLNYKVKVWRTPAVVGGTVKSVATIDTGGGMTITTELIESKRK